MRPITAILIDPVARTVSTVEVDADDYKAIYPLIDATTFSCIAVGNGDALYIDDEGLLKSENTFFRLGSYRQSLAGKALVLGTDKDGDSIAPKIDVETVRANVTFRGRATIEGTPSGGFILAFEDAAEFIPGPQIISLGGDN